VDAEHAGQDRSGEFGGELEQGGGAGRPGADADLAETFAELAGADRLARASAGQQPWGGALVSGGGVALAGGDQVKDESGEWFGECDGFPADLVEGSSQSITVWPRRSASWPGLSRIPGKNFRISMIFVPVSGT
jgi:hypothetical protein